MLLFFFQFLLASKLKDLLGYDQCILNFVVEDNHNGIAWLIWITGDMFTINILQECTFLTDTGNCLLQFY